MSLVVSDRKIGYFNSYILQRIRNNKNFISAITGSTGSGKSWSALREGEVLDPDFDIRNVVFTPQQFMDLVNEKTKKLHKGSVLVFDEIQVSMGHLDYQALQSKLLNYLFQTFRSRNFILFLTSPHFKFINASLRKLFHCRMETVSINYKKQTTTIKPLLLQTNQESGEIYRKYLRVWTKTSGVVPLKVLRVKKPSADLIKAYEKKKDEFITELNEGIAMDLERLEEKNRKSLTTQQKKIVRSLSEGKLIPDIAKGMNKTTSLIYRQIELIQKKQIKIIPIKVGRHVDRYEVEGKWDY